MLVRLPRLATIVAATAVLVSACGVSAASAADAPESREATARSWGPAEGWSAFSHWTRDVQGRTVRTIYAQPAFTRVGGEWVQVDPRVDPTPDGRYAGSAERAALPVRFGRTASSLLVLGPAAAPLVLSSRGLRITDPELSAAGATYAEVARSTDLNYAVTPDGVKERIVLKTAAAPRSFTFHLSDPLGCLGTPIEAPDGSVTFEPKADLPGLRVSAPFAVDHRWPSRL